MHPQEDIIAPYLFCMKQHIVFIFASCIALSRSQYRTAATGDVGSFHLIRNMSPYKQKVNDSTGQNPKICNLQNKTIHPTMHAKSDLTV